MNLPRFIVKNPMTPHGNRLPSAMSVFAGQALGFASHGFPWFAFFIWVLYLYHKGIRPINEWVYIPIKSKYFLQ